MPCGTIWQADLKPDTKDSYDLSSVVNFAPHLRHHRGTVEGSGLPAHSLKASVPLFPIGFSLQTDHSEKYFLICL